MQRTDAHRFEKDPAAFKEGFLHLALNDVRPPITPPPTCGCKRLARNPPTPFPLWDVLDMEAVLTADRANLNLDAHEGTCV